MMQRNLLCANDVFVQIALTALALCPEARELGLQRGLCANLLLVDLRLLVLAMAAHGAVQFAVAQNRLAAHASLLLLGEHGEAANF